MAAWMDVTGRGPRYRNSRYCCSKLNANGGEGGREKMFKGLSLARKGKRGSEKGGKRGGEN